MQLLDFKPTMINLKKISTRQGELKIVEESAHKYREIGIILLKDKTGTKVNAIDREMKGVPVDAVREIYSRWLMEDEDHSWKKLALCLRDCDLNVLAKAIEEHFGLLPPQLSQEGVCYYSRM